jgi:hypothetical protein
MSTPPVATSNEFWEPQWTAEDEEKRNALVDEVILDIAYDKLRKQQVHDEQQMRYINGI